MLGKGTQSSDLITSGFWLMEMLPQYYLNSHPVSENPFVSCAIWLGYLNTCDTCVHFSSSGPSGVTCYILPPPCTLFLMIWQQSGGAPRWVSAGCHQLSLKLSPGSRSKSTEAYSCKLEHFFFQCQSSADNLIDSILTGLMINQSSIYPCFATNNQYLSLLSVSGMIAVLP